MTGSDGARRPRDGRNASPGEGPAAHGRIGGVELHGVLVCSDLDEAVLVKRHLPTHADLSRAEPGCLAFDVVPTADPLVFRVDEAFTDAEAFRAHQRRVASSEWGHATAGITREYTVEGLT